MYFVFDSSLQWKTPEFRMDDRMCECWIFHFWWVCGEFLPHNICVNILYHITTKKMAIFWKCRYLAKNYENEKEIIEYRCHNTIGFTSKELNSMRHLNYAPFKWWGVLNSVSEQMCWVCALSVCVLSPSTSKIYFLTIIRTDVKSH